MSLKAQDIEQAMKAAYDLRSRYVHTGVHFGSWVRSDPQLEQIAGSPLVDDEEFKKILMRAPNLTGLERVMRYSLLKIAQNAGADLASLYGVPANGDLDDNN